VAEAAVKKTMAKERVCPLENGVKIALVAHAFLSLRLGQGAADVGDVDERVADRKRSDGAAFHACPRNAERGVGEGQARRDEEEPHSEACGYLRRCHFARLVVRRDWRCGIEEAVEGQDRQPRWREGARGAGECFLPLALYWFGSGIVRLFLGESIFSRGALPRPS